MLELTGKDTTKLESLLSLFKNRPANLENVSQLVGKEKISLLLDLQQSQIKFTPEDILRIDSSRGKIFFLEKGNSKSGLQHIEQHASEFSAKGISREQIPDIVMRAVKEGNIAGYQGQGTGRAIYEINLNGKVQYIAITVSDNGFIVGANPTGKP